MERKSGSEGGTIKPAIMESNESLIPSTNNCKEWCKMSVLELSHPRNKEAGARESYANLHI